MSTSAKDYTCGLCGLEFTSNLPAGDITCGECDGQLCPHCGTWFGYGGEVPAGTPEPPLMTPAVVRPVLGGVLVLAVGTGAPDASVQAAAEALAAADEGATVVTVRGVDALRTWHPADAPAELAAAVAKLDAIAQLTAEMHAVADASSDEAKGAALHEYASRIRKLLGPDLDREALEGP